ncbi:FAD-dependent oxidoreductase [Ruficoccus amylovorans]|uniref:FAD-dependent oxidoreductase n=1 Tax=Ruficoccus amylovorans TaxID=1804625 RepID=A0A842HID1_9BACT|nr:hydroxysqualene dehydroxylase HpnE [Ruficoccus amylovorans]MBC2595346.1 FAD-dependent oxidoreductase [Ruficoccus amylovorans]
MSSESKEAVQARKKSNLAFTFMSLEPERREAMAVFYDFCRIADDIADEPGRTDDQKRAELDAWRKEIESCYRVDGVPIKLMAEMKPVIDRYGVEKADLLAIIDGVSMDIGGARFASFEHLRRYCYGVASAVGLVSIKIFGCTHPRTPEFAETLGYALQFTNILRDVVEDKVKMGRVYLPQDELAALEVSEDDLANPAANPACQKLFRLCYYRCKHFFNKARRLLPDSERQNLKAALVMGAFYEEILEKIAAGGFALTVERTRLSKPQKLRLLWRTLREAKRPGRPRSLPGRAAVLGGGVAGITAALELGLEGFTPHLYEARTYLGGRAHSLTDAATGLTIDNGQHIVMGCYTGFLKLAELLGITDKLERQPSMRVPYVSPGGRWSELAAQPLPAPFNLLAGLFKFSELNTADRLAILRMGLVMRLEAVPADDETAAHWLRRHGQTAGSVRALWEPFCVAALNEPTSTASARLLHETLRRSLFGKSDAADIIVSKVGLSELFEPETSLFLNSIGGSLSLSSKIARVEVAEDRETGIQRVTAVETPRGERIEAELFVSALPWTALRSLLPEGSRLRDHLAAIPSAPIMGIHLVTDRPLYDNGADFVGLLDSPVHWVFDRTHTLPPEYAGKHLYAVISSTAQAWLDMKSDEIVTLLRTELEKFFPAATEMQIARSLVYKSRDATFAAQPATEPHRPGPKASPWSNFLLAGDYTATGLPATLESAALSGFAVSAALDG